MSIIPTQCEDVIILDKDPREIIFVVRGENYIPDASIISKVIKGLDISMHVRNDIYNVSFTDEQRRIFASYLN